MLCIPTRLWHGRQNGYFPDWLKFHQLFVWLCFKVISANQDRDTIALHFFSVVLVAQYVRFLPQNWTNKIWMRIELYGCPLGKATDCTFIHFVNVIGKNWLVKLKWPQFYPSPFPQMQIKVTSLTGLISTLSCKPTKTLNHPRLKTMDILVRSVIDVLACRSIFLWRK